MAVFVATDQLARVAVENPDSRRAERAVCLRLARVGVAGEDQAEHEEGQRPSGVLDAVVGGLGMFGEDFHGLLGLGRVAVGGLVDCEAAVLERGERAVPGIGPGPPRSCARTASSWDASARPACPTASP
ncbi:hypothetical protein, partial [Micrococcus sp. KRD096]|uniref:hypothetical protein n=1 Tax=Micrococcus sp. KRD096 TaxID=2729721 RepID=UPI0019D1F484